MSPRVPPSHHPESPPQLHKPLLSESPLHPGRGDCGAIGPSGSSGASRSPIGGLLISATIGVLLGITALIGCLHAAQSGGSETAEEILGSSLLFLIAVFLTGWAGVGLGLGAFYLARRTRRRIARGRTIRGRTIRGRTIRRRTLTDPSATATAAAAAARTKAASRAGLFQPGEIEHARLHSLPPFSAELLIVTDRRIMRVSTDVTGAVTRLSEQTVAQLALARGEEFRRQATVIAEFHNGSSIRLEGTHPVEAQRFVSIIDDLLAHARRRPPARPRLLARPPRGPRRR